LWYTDNVRVGELQRKYGYFEEEEKQLFLPGIERKFQEWNPNASEIFLVVQSGYKIHLACCTRAVVNLQG
jgi:hypothetical protein